ncbi:PTS sugar transporter subunit IIA [Thermodesulfobacteriota bacterium]
MKISEIISPKLIIASLQGTTKKQVLEELVKHLAHDKESIDADELLRVLIEREKLGSTGIGGGIAIPHGKLQGLDAIALVFGKSVDGIDFDAIDGKPVNLVFLLVAPSNSAGVHLKALARLSRLLKNNGFRQALMQAADDTSLYDIIAVEDSKVSA